MWFVLVVFLVLVVLVLIYAVQNTLLQASNTEMMWVVRLAVVVAGVVSTLLSITVNHVFGLLYLATDVGLFVLLPELFCTIYVPWSNVWGCLTGVVVGVFLRVSAGEPLLGLPALIKYPFYLEEEGLQMFPYRTLSCIVSTFSIMLVSWITLRLCPNYNRPNRGEKDSNEGDHCQGIPLMDSKTTDIPEKDALIQT